MKYIQRFLRKLTMDPTSMNPLSSTGAMRKIFKAFKLNLFSDI